MDMHFRNWQCETREDEITHGFTERTSLSLNIYMKTGNVPVSIYILLWKMYSFIIKKFYFFSSI